VSYDRVELVEIIEHNLVRNQSSHIVSDHVAHQLGNAMLDFIEWFQLKDFGRKYVSVQSLLFTCIL